MALGNQPTVQAGSIYLAQLADDKTNRQQIKSQYQTALTRLTQIQNATNPTNAQIVAAIQDIAKYEFWIMKALARML